MWWVCLLRVGKIGTFSFLLYSCLLFLGKHVRTMEERIAELWKLIYGEYYRRICFTSEFSVLKKYYLIWENVLQAIRTPQIFVETNCTCWTGVRGSQDTLGGFPMCWNCLNGSRTDHSSGRRGSWRLSCNKAQTGAQNICWNPEAHFCPNNKSLNLFQIIILHLGGEGF